MNNLKQLSTPVLLVTYKRLDTTKQVFEAIKKIKPKKLYISSNIGKNDEETKIVLSVRKYLEANVDWDCEIKKLYRTEHVNAELSISGAINWFFDNEEMGIILEDDCLPSQSFFWFCEKILDMYKNDTRVSMVAGTSYLFNEINSEDDYFFSRYMAIWGWATWKSRWEKYDVNMKDWPKIKESNVIEGSFYWDKNIQKHFFNDFEASYKKEIDTWDFQWTFRCLAESTYCITPYKNLVSNIGVEGTHGSGYSPFINMKRLEIDNIENLKLSLPVMHNYNVDKILFYNVFDRFITYRVIVNKGFIYLLKKIKLYHFAKKIRRYINV